MTGRVSSNDFSVFFNRQISDAQGIGNHTMRYIERPDEETETHPGRPRHYPMDHDRSSEYGLRRFRK